MITGKSTRCLPTAQSSGSPWSWIEHVPPLPDWSAARASEPILSGSSTMHCEADGWSVGACWSSPEIPASFANMSRSWIAPAAAAALLGPDLTLTKTPNAWMPTARGPVGARSVTSEVDATTGRRGPRSVTPSAASLQTGLGPGTTDVEGLTRFRYSRPNRLSGSRRPMSTAFFDWHKEHRQGRTRSVLVTFRPM